MSGPGTPTAEALIMSTGSGWMVIDANARNAELGFAPTGLELVLLANEKGWKVLNKDALVPIARRMLKH